jgi:RNA polymerase sigma-70 factor (ECF subfamily)
MIEGRPAGNPSVVGRQPATDPQPDCLEVGLSRHQSDRRLENLVRAYLPFVWRVLRRMGLSEQDADDAVQSVFIAVTSRIDSLVEGSERAFLYRTAANVALRVRRTYRRRPDYAPEPLDESPDDMPNPEQLLDERRARQRLDRLLMGLPSDLRAPFVLFEIEGLSQPEIAEALGIPVGTVASRLRRARDVFAQKARRPDPMARTRGGAS